MFIDDSGAIGEAALQRMVEAAGQLPEQHLEEEAGLPGDYGWGGGGDPRLGGSALGGGLGGEGISQRVALELLGQVSTV